MKIEDIKNPDFLKTLSVEELNALSGDIRKFLIESVSKTGGHLSSNLGIVELTVALHYVFNCPRDRFLFDVGHQSYIHKILTGRADKMSTLRQFGGLSGFIKRNESEYDCFEAGHSSTSLSAALGMAVARDLKGEHYDIVPIVGDGALMSGLSLEALNQIGYEKKKVIIVFNDNNMSISKNVGALSKSFAKLRSSAYYNELKSDVKDALKTKKLGNFFIKGVHNFKESIKKSVVDSGVFGEFGIEYLGPIDGYDMNTLINAFRTAQAENGPIVVHVITQKGKGYKYTEQDKNGTWHGVGKFDVETGRFLSSVPAGYKSYSEMVSDEVLYNMDKRKDIVALTPAMISGSKMAKIFAKYPTRSFDCGIAEDHALEFAAGLALNGMHPFVAIYSSFLQRAYDQLNHDLCRMDLPVVLGLDRSGLVGEDGDTHHGVFDISFMKSLPNMIIAEGKDAKETGNLIYTAFNTPHPFAIRYPRGNVKNKENEENSLIEVGKWTVEYNNDSTRAIIITYGNDVDELVKLVCENSLNYEIVNARFIKPMDSDMLCYIAERDVPVYVYTCDMLSGGLAEEILSFYNKKGMDVNLKSVGIPDTYVPQGTVAQLKEYLGIDLKTFLEQVEKDLNA